MMDGEIHMPKRQKIIITLGKYYKKEDIDVIVAAIEKELQEYEVLCSSIRTQK